MPETTSSFDRPLRVRFAPSPTGFLHVGSARTFILNWLFARHNGGDLVLRLDDTDVERNTDASVQSIFEGLKWLGLNWDEEYKQSERLQLHREKAEEIFAKGFAYRDFTPAHAGDEKTSSAQGAWLFNPGMREMSREESDRRAAAGEPFALRYRVPRSPDSGVARMLHFNDSVYGAQSKLANEVEDFALLRSDGMPTYHLASCADDADLRISHIIRGQDHLTNTFKHILIFEALGADELTALFTLEGVNRANAVINFSDADPFDPKAVWLNAEHIRALPVDQLSECLAPFFKQAGFNASPEKTLAVAPLIRERIKLLGDAPAAADFFFLPELAPYDPAELIPQKGDAALAMRVLKLAQEVLATTAFDHDSLDAALRAAAAQLGLKAGPMFQPIRVAVCGRKNAPPLFETMVVLGRDVCLDRIRKAEANLQPLL